VAFDTYVQLLKSKKVETTGLHFGHASFFKLPSPYPALCASYHPSRQNTQTGKLTVKMFDEVFQEIRLYLAE